MARFVWAAAMFVAMCAVTVGVVTEPASAQRAGPAPSAAASAASIVVVYKNAD